MAEMIGKELWERLLKANEENDAEMVIDLLAMAQVNVFKNYIKFIESQKEPVGN